MAVRFFITLPEPEQARGDDPDLSFRSVSAEGFAEEVQAALRTDVLVNKWRAKHDNDDDVDERYCAVDANATVVGKQDDLHVDLEITTELPSEVLKNRLYLLAGKHWKLHDVRSA